MKSYSFLLLVIVLCLSQSLCAQNTEKKSRKPITVTGKVLYMNESPVMGAVLYIDNIRTSIVTKQDGSYKIKVSPTIENLEVRSPEYGSCIFPIAGHSVINFNLNGQGGIAYYPDKNSSDNKAKKIRKMNTYNDIYQMIRVEVPDVVVSGRSVQVRQGHSFYGGATPLFTVNGVIVQSIDNINPLDVKSIGLLKGSAAAIYGVNGSNGVISITLKNGRDD